MTGSAEGTNGRSELRGERGRFSSRRKAEAVLRLLHGEELDALSLPHPLRSWSLQHSRGGSRRTPSRSVWSERSGANVSTI